ncbi:SdiA-regulated domain-containing protein [Pedobacter metabolipauper]|nr:SdiA-regulated domain-containing protein [Pedobacter metabolipauper]
MKKLYTKFYYIVIPCVLFGVLSCKNPVDKFTSPKGYDLKKPDKFNMPSSLLEISGIAFHNNNSDTIYSIQDENGKLYKQKWDVKKQINTKFSPNGDFEDLTILKNNIFVLRSDGVFFSFPITESGKKETKNVHEIKGLLPKGEYESIYADNEKNQIYVLCKSCPGDKKTKMVSGYIFDYIAASDSLVSSGEFKVNLQGIEAVNPKVKTNLSPSAMTRNPRTNEWYILSSANKLLIITDSKWNITEAHRLNSSTFNQPEGLAFDTDFNLYIANEGDEITDGNIIKFKYVPAQSK